MRKFAVILAMVVLAAACAGEQEVVSGGLDDPTPPGSDVPEPGDAELLLSVEVSGGFLPTGVAFRAVPSAVVYGDGTTFSPAATAAVYPGPAAPPITRGRLAEDDLERLIAAADAAGLLDEVAEDFGQPPVADAATTTVRVVIGGEARVASVYALNATATGLPAMPGPPGVSPAQLEARKRVADYVELVTQAVLAVEGEPYVAERYRILPLAPEPSVDPAVEPDERRWPFPEIVLRGRECTAVSGDRAIELGDALRSATEITRWRTASDETFVLSVRPVLPHEPDCPG
ncbi:MAG TPA: hypothetical protein VGR26_03465 [Acidimicrobiales bacterium]|nr:hypothetical protein [Acidimicrobiales bacterium]